MINKNASILTEKKSKHLAVITLKANLALKVTL